MQHYNDTETHQDDLITESGTNDKAKKVKAHVVRRNIEDYLAEKALKRRLKDVFEDEFDFA